MKNKILTAISTIMLFVPWTILPLRTFDCGRSWRTSRHAYAYHNHKEKVFGE